VEQNENRTKAEKNIGIRTFARFPKANLPHFGVIFVRDAEKLI
jgi:hypothetical protein